MALVFFFLGTRKRLFITAVIFTLAALVASWAVTSYIRDHSVSVGFNLVVITMWMLLLIGGGFFQAVLLGDLFFKGRWRERTFLGWEPAIDSPEALDGEGLKERNVNFYMLLLVAIAVNYLVIDAVNGGFFAWYHQRGFAYTQMRATDHQEREAALLDLEEHRDPEVLGRVAGALRDPEPVVRDLAAFIVGFRNYEPAEETLRDLARSDADPVVRGTALQALARLEGEEAVALAREGLAGEGQDVRIKAGASGALGLLKERSSRSMLEEILEADISQAPGAAAGGVDRVALEELGEGGDHIDAEERLRMVTVWALGELGERQAQEALLRVVEDGRGADRCVALHALGKVGEEGAADTLKEVYQSHEVDWYCPREFVCHHAHRRCFRGMNVSGASAVVDDSDGSCIHLQMTSPELFRSKLIRTVARLKGKEAIYWLAEVNQDEDLAPEIRNLAADLFKQLNRQR